VWAFGERPSSGYDWEVGRHHFAQSVERQLGQYLQAPAISILNISSHLLASNFDIQPLHGRKSPGLTFALKLHQIPSRIPRDNPTYLPAYYVLASNDAIKYLNIDQPTIYDIARPYEPSLDNLDIRLSLTVRLVRTWRMGKDP
jgi:hypothetical protein